MHELNNFIIIYLIEIIYFLKIKKKYREEREREFRWKQSPGPPETTTWCLVTRTFKP